MRKNVLVLALVATVLPALALAAQPVLIRVEGHYVPAREVVQVIHTAAGPVRVHTWSWRAPDGAGTIQMSETRGAAPPMPVWAMAQMRALQAQMQLIQTMMLQQPMLGSSLPVPAAYGQPLWLALPGQAPLEVRFLRPMIPLRVTPLPVRILVILPEPRAHTTPPASVQPRGHLT